MSFKDQLIALDACQEAVDWVDTKTIEEVWETCHEIEWLLWILNHTPVTVEREISQAMALDFVARVEHLNDIPETHQILQNAKKRHTKQDKKASIGGSTELRSLIGPNAPDVNLRSAAQALFQAGQTTNDKHDDKEVLFRAFSAAAQAYKAEMETYMNTVPRGSHDLHAAKDAEIRQAQLAILRKHIPVSKIKQLWVFPNA